MKLGVSYNVFDGEELLEGSIKSIRQSVDYISVVYQTISNFGKECSKDLLPLLERLKKDKLINDIVFYQPISLPPHVNETRKRQIGLELSLKNDCTHHMSMDADEYYEKSNLDNVKKMMIINEYDSSYCQMLTYYKTWEYKLDPPEEYFVPLIYRIKHGTTFVLSTPSPVLVDPTRRISGITKPLILKREQIQMHHGSYIRDDIRKKLENSSASINFKDDIEKLVNHYENWKYPDLVMWGGRPSKFLKVLKVENLFQHKHL